MLRVTIELLPFDIVINDGSHESHEQMFSFDVL